MLESYSNVHLAEPGSEKVIELKAPFHTISDIANALVIVSAVVSTCFLADNNSVSSCAQYAS